MAIKEVLVPSWVPEPLPLVCIAQHGAREPVERAYLGLVALAADVDDDTLAVVRGALVRPVNVQV